MNPNKPTIFIVDDEPLLLKMLTDYLNSRDSELNIRSFATGEACLNHLNEKPEMVILDYYLNSKEMNAADGIDILKEIKKNEKSLPVIMLSAQESYVTATQSIGYGATHYVIKGQGAFEDIYQLIKTNVL